MLSPKMQRTVRVNDSQLIMLSERAAFDHSLSGPLHKKTADSTKWQLRWFILYQNLLFYYETENSSRPSGVIFLEGCYCERFITTSSRNKDIEKPHSFAISYRRENLRQYELRATTENDCKTWIEAIREASFNKLLLQKEELEQKHLHLLQIVESEKTAKWQYTQQCEELTSEIKMLRAELCALKKEWRPEASGKVNQSSSVSIGAGGQARGAVTREEEEEQLKMNKIKKVQSFFRGWLCRRRWKQIVVEYIKSPHAESMRKRNSLVFRMVEAEEEYNEHLEILVSCFLRPFKMAASSKNPPCSHEEVNSIFLNIETIMFLHQIFLKGLTSRMESWPTLVLGDLFDMLLPMLSIYQEFVRNHHYSLQVLTEGKQRQPFAQLLNRLEKKPGMNRTTLETLLTIPMHQVPKYISTLREVLAHTPHDHVERKSLMNASQQLEDLSRQMHDEVSETENLRKNLSVERLIVEGCDILLDVNQVFVRQGTLIQIPNEKPKRPRLFSSTASEKDAKRQCFLFSHHLIITTRKEEDSKRLYLHPDGYKIPIADLLLIEDPNDDDASESSVSSQCSDTESSYGGRDFKIISGDTQVHLLTQTLQEKASWVTDINQCIDNVHFTDIGYGSTAASDTSSIHHSFKNDPKLFKDDVDIRYSRNLYPCMVPHIRYATPERLLERLTDLRFLSIDFLNTFLLTYRVFTDGETVLEALKKVYYEAEPVDKCVESLMSMDEGPRDDNFLGLYDTRRRSSCCASPRRVSAASTVSGYCSEMSDRDRSHSYDSQCHANTPSKSHWRCSHRKFEEEQRELERIKEGSAVNQNAPQTPTTQKKIVTIRVEESDDDAYHLTVPHSMNASSSNETLTDVTVRSASTSPSNLSSVTLVATDNQDAKLIDFSSSNNEPTTAPRNTNVSASTISNAVVTVTVDDSASSSASRSEEEKKTDEDDCRHVRRSSMKLLYDVQPKSSSWQLRRKSMDYARLEDEDEEEEEKPKNKKDSLKIFQRDSRKSSMFSDGLLSIDNRFRRSRSKSAEKRVRSLYKRKGSDGSIVPLVKRKGSEGSSRESSFKSSPSRRKDSGRSSRESPPWSTKRKSSSWYRRGRTNDIEASEDSGSELFYQARSASISTTNSNTTQENSSKGTEGTKRSSIQYESPKHASKAGVVITSFRQSKRRSSTSAAASAFAIATSASSNPRERPSTASSTCSGMRARASVGDVSLSSQNRCRKESCVTSNAATMRVLNVLKHWVSKHGQDFECDRKLRNSTIEFLEDIAYSPGLLPAELKETNQLLRLLSKDELESRRMDPNILSPPKHLGKESIETLSALEIAEQITYIDYKIFTAIRSDEFMSQAWMKADKAIKAPHVILWTRRFNEVSRLVVSEILRRTDMNARAAIIDKWASVAGIARVMHNFNGVLMICSAFTNSSVFRLKKTWEKVSKTSKHTIEKLLEVVSSASRYRCLRDTMHCRDHCIPYLGMFLSDLSVIEEGTPNFTEEGLVNFSKMRMVSHVVREIRRFQESLYKIKPSLIVIAYLMDTSLLSEDEELYQLSLELEPRMSRLDSNSTVCTEIPEAQSHGPY